MKIRTKIKLVGISLILLAVIVYSFIFWQGKFAESEHQKENTATQIIKTIFEMDTLINEHLLNPGERSAGQWQSKYVAIEYWLSKTIFENMAAEQELIDRMRQESILLKSSFEKLAVINEQGIPGLDTEIIRNRLISQLSESGNRMVEAALLLTERLRARESKIQALANNIGILIVIIALLIGYFGSKVLIKNILSPLNELSKFAQEISHGKFNTALSKALLRREDEFGQLSKTFEHMTQNVATIDRNKSEFISIAAHQLRTPVSSLSWLTEALEFESQNFSPKQKTYLKDLGTMSKRLTNLIEDLLNFSRIKLKSPMGIEKNDIEITSFIERFIREIGNYAASKEHTIIFNKEVGMPIDLKVNERSLYNILENIVSNAIDYSPANTAVTIDLEKTDDFIRISVSNKGPLIPTEEQSHIFERFFRGESGKKIKPEGTGLGLYVVKIIVESIGGRIGFDSEEGKDTMFWFTIPLKAAIMNENKPNN